MGAKLAWSFAHAESLDPEKAILAIVLFGLVGGSWVWSWHWIKGREPKPPNASRADTKLRIEARLLDFIQHGNRAQNAYHAAYQAKDAKAFEHAQRQVEEWREAFGTYCDEEPSLKKRDAHIKTLDKGGDRISEPLRRIRNMVERLDEWVD